MTSPFLDAPQSSWVAANDLAFALPDPVPVGPGHTLVVPRRLVATWFDATPAEHAAIFALVADVKRALDAELRPDGYNIGIDDGEAAGQTVMHLHVHVIPRFRGDVSEPRGGVRWVIPGLASPFPSLATGGTEDPFLRHLVPLFERATEVAVVAAFVLETGLLALEGHVAAARARGAVVKVVTGNYLDVTEVGALRRLLAWSLDDTRPGRLEARIVDMAELPGPRPTFHPKSWRFEGPEIGVAFVGSSNISRAALTTGIEWNLRVESRRDPRAYQEVARAFERLWARAHPLTAPWIDAYEQRVGEARNAFAFAFAEGDAPMPHGIQIEALAALARSRDEDLRRRAVVVLATGLGKTWLAAFDAAAYAASRLGGRVPRVLFIAHREELLAQAETTFRWMFHKQHPTFGVFAGPRSELDADLVFASVQKLSRPEHLARLLPGRFDYAIVDEVHHGAAQSYRAVLDRLDAGFLLGLTATPDRADGADVLGLFDDHIAFRADIGVGIQRKLLVPFSYFGLADAVDYQAIRWQDQRFDPAELAAAVDTESRLEQMWRAWTSHDGRRTIVFCCTIAHAEHARAFLSSKGVKAVAVHSGPGSAPRAEALESLQAGTLEAVCAVDLLNEGVDVPRVDRVVMLRPTESPVVFLQQLGRGLRVAAGKERLTVLDFIGNHRIFLDRIRKLTALAETPSSVRALLEAGGASEILPGCPIEITLEAKQLLLHLLQGRTPRSAVENAYREIVAARDVRPTAGELHRMGYPLEALRKPPQGWFDFVTAEHGLSDAEARVFAAATEWLRDLETTRMNTSFKMVTLEALLEAGALTEGMAVPELSRRSYAILLRSPELFLDLADVKGLGDPRAPNEKQFEAYWRTRKNPIDAWTSGRGGRQWFVLKDDRFLPALPVPAGDEARFTAMTRELVDYRLAQYRARRKQETPWRVLVTYPDLRAAAGAASVSVELPRETETVRLPTRARGKGLFAVRATGDSMDGGRRPIRDGDWLVMRPARGVSLADVEGKVALLESPDRDFGFGDRLKRVVRDGEGWLLRSENPARPSLAATRETVVVAVLVDVVRPEDVEPTGSTETD